MSSINSLNKIKFKMNLNHPSHMAIYRTENILRPTYYGDGKGRDSYVFQNNGGFRDDREMMGSQPKSGWNINTRAGSPDQKFRMTAQGGTGLAKRTSVIHYTSDGTGRDSYIIKNSGGTCNEYTVGFVKYPDEYLRDDKKHPNTTP